MIYIDRVKLAPSKLTAPEETREAHVHLVGQRIVDPLRMSEHTNRVRSVLFIVVFCYLRGNILRSKRVRFNLLCKRLGHLLLA